MTCNLILVFLYFFNLEQSYKIKCSRPRQIMSVLILLTNKASLLLLPVVRCILALCARLLEIHVWLMILLAVLKTNVPKRDHLKCEGLVLPRTKLYISTTAMFSSSFLLRFVRYLVIIRSLSSFVNNYHLLVIMFSTLRLLFKQCKLVFCT